MTKEEQITIESNAHRLVNVCGQLRSDERALVVADNTTKEVGKLLHRYASEVTPKAKFILISSRGMHGVEPPEYVAQAMGESDVIFGVTKSSMAHTKARVNATNKGARYLSLADYSFTQLARPALTVDFFHWGKVAKILKNLFDSAKRIRATTENGTDIQVACEGRVANFCPGFCASPGSLGSPPDIETNISPTETESNGVIVADGSIPCGTIGLVKEPFTIIVKKGRIVSIDQTKFQGRAMEELLKAYPPNARVLAEFGVGLNPKAELCGLMLEDEGCLGTIHLGFGSNITVGGLNDVNFHLDVVIRQPSVWVDSNLIINDGVIHPKFTV